MPLWIESHTELGSHKKLYQFCRELKIDCVQAVGHLHYLWWWTILNRPNGDLIGLFPVDIAQAAKWSGDPKKFLEALKKSGWLVSMKLYDWENRYKTLLNARKRKKKWLQERSLERSENDSKNVPEQVTRPDHTLPYQKKELKTGFFSKDEEKIILQDIAIKRGVAPESMAASLRLIEIKEEIAKLPDVKKPLAMARHKAQTQ